MCGLKNDNYISIAEPLDGSREENEEIVWKISGMIGKGRIRDGFWYVDWYMENPKNLETKERFQNSPSKKKCKNAACACDGSCK